MFYVVYGPFDEYPLAFFKDATAAYDYAGTIPTSRMFPVDFDPKLFQSAKHHISKVDVEKVVVTDGSN